MSTTIQDEHIEAAVAQGIITAEQAARLRELARADAAPAEPSEPAADPDDERFRLIGGFNDVFVTIGVVLLVLALVALAKALGYAFAFITIAVAAAWGLSEVFSKRMRLALPSIALALMFAWAGGYLASTIGGAVLSINTDEIGQGPGGGIVPLLFGLGAVIAAALHDWRFHVPIDAAIMAAGVMCAIYGATNLLAPEWLVANQALLFALFGVGTFIAAIRVDAGDPQRLTRRSDRAFWLHLLAAPLIVHAIIPSVSGAAETPDAWRAIAILLVFALLALIALIIDRRALLVSGLSYAGFAIAYLISQSVTEDLSVSLTLLGLAVLVLGLSVGWRSLRRLILPALPLGRLRQFIPSAV